MQGRENSSGSIVGRNLLQNLYPGNCGYKSETGGIMKNLRETTTNENVIKHFILSVIILQFNYLLIFMVYYRFASIIMHFIVLKICYFLSVEK